MNQLSKSIEVELTKEQYKALLKLTYCGEWVLNSYKTSEDKVFRETDKLMQYLFSFAWEFDMNEWLEYDEKAKQYFPTSKMEDAFHKYIEKYNLKQK